MSRADDVRFDSWKEIANYLGHDVRTARRWEEERGLPVHRVPGGGRRAVYAYRSEIDAWLLSAGPNPNGISQASAATQQTEAPHALEARQSAAGESSVEERLKNPQSHGALGSGHRFLANWLRLNKPVAVVWVLLAVSCLVFLVLHAFPRTAIASATFGQSEIVARDQAGKTLWTYDFGQLLWLHKSDDDDPSKRIQVADLRGDGQQEVLVVAPLCLVNSGDLSSDVLYCFNGKGKVLWKHPFEERVRFGGKVYGPRWQFGALMANAKESPGTIWCAVNNLPWWPSLLEQFDAEGNLKARFVNAGHIHSLNSFASAEGSFILAGGINNEYESAMLAVLGEANLSGASPQTAGSAFRCDDCASGLPYRYFLFPRSIVNQLSGRAFNTVKVIQAGGDGIKVVVNEALDNPGLGYDWQMYEFSADFFPKSVSVSDHYWEDYLQLYSQGRIKLARGERPVRAQAGTVRGWDAQNGWKEFRVAGSGSQIKEKAALEAK